MFAYPEEYEEVKHRVEVLRKKQEEVVLEVISTQSLLFLIICLGLATIAQTKLFHIGLRRRRCCIKQFPGINSWAT